MRGLTSDRVTLAFGVIACAWASTFMLACANEFADCEAAKTCGASGIGGTDSGPGGADSSGGEKDVDSGKTGTGGSGTGGHADSLRADAATSKDGSPVTDASASEAAAPEAAPPPCSSVEGGISSDPDHCGSCDVVCGADGVANRACEEGLCKPKCDATHSDCDHDGKNGCEITSADDPDHCGSCDVVCGGDGVATRACVEGVCKPKCDATHGDCDGDGKNGCEVDITNDPDNCGACDFVCSGSQVKTRHCVASVCSPECSTGRGDCGKPFPAPDDGCETNLTTPTDCGRCGHDCLGGACNSSLCEAVTVASGLSYVAAFTVDSHHIFYVDAPASGTGHVTRTELDGKNGVTMMTGLVNATAIASDDTYVYAQTIGATLHSADAAIRRVLGAGSTSQTPTNVVTGQSSSLFLRPTVLAVDGTNAYFADQYAPAAYAVNKAGGSPVQINTAGVDQNYIPSDVAVDATDLYVLQGPFIWAVPIATGVPKITTVNQASGTGIAIDSGFFYFRMYDSVTSKPVMARIPKGKAGVGNASVIAPASYSGGALAVDGTYLYFDDAGVYRVAKGGGTRQLLSSATSNAAKMYARTEGSQTVLYWLNNAQSSSGAGSIVRLAP